MQKVGETFYKQVLSLFNYISFNALCQIEHFNKEIQEMTKGQSLSFFEFTISIFCVVKIILMLTLFLTYIKEYNSPSVLVVRCFKFDP